MRQRRVVWWFVVVLAVASGCASGASGAPPTPSPAVPTQPPASNAAPVSPSAPAASSPSASAAGEPGKFGLGGSVGASLETATALSDGRVLLAGGLACGTGQLCPTTAEARLFDPATGSFTVVGPMGSARSELAATLLGDGSVLIAGGSSAPDTELFDPATGKFAAGAAMAVDRHGLAAARLADGRVLVSGGWGGPRGSVKTYSSAEVYDPATHSFEAAGEMTVARTYHTATTLADGRVLIAGGKGVYPNDGLASAEVFDPKTGAFAATGSMAAPRQHAAAALLRDGRVLVVGGESGIVGSPLIEIFDPAAGTFTTAGRLPLSLIGASATTLADGRVLIAGGRPAANEDESLASKSASAAYLFEPATGAVAATGSMAAGREEHSATLLSDGRVLIAGGWRDNAQVLTAEIYVP